MPGGERHSALESVKLLLASRPVVFLGFGLRDPDFLYVKDLLANTYKGGIRDHFAMVPDVGEPEKDYWRACYGIHLISYSTTAIGGVSDHSELLRMLEALSMLSELPSPSTHKLQPEHLLALARHAATLSLFERAVPSLTIRVHAFAAVEATAGRHTSDRFDHWRVEQFLSEGPSKAVLVGSPGAGKTYAMKVAAADMAEKLHAECLNDEFKAEGVVVPLYADLKLYRGSLADLVSTSLPAGLSLELLNQNVSLKFFFDSFNEMPREFLEDGVFEADFRSFLEAFSGNSILFGSRSTDGLAKLGLAAYQLDQIDRDQVISELKKRGVSLTYRFGGEITSLLQRPFYFSLVARGLVHVPREPHPRDIYQSFFSRICDAFETRFGTYDLVYGLSSAAHESIVSGKEAASLKDFMWAYSERIQTDPQLSSEMINWLVSKAILIPYSGSRIAFFHQSVTEYLMLLKSAASIRSRGNMS
jgi:SIR2-like protein